MIRTSMAKGPPTAGTDHRHTLAVDLVIHIVAVHVDDRHGQVSSLGVKQTLDTSGDTEKMHVSAKAGHKVEAHGTRA